MTYFFLFENNGPVSKHISGDHSSWLLPVLYNAGFHYTLQKSLAE
ncbi:MAG: hypothetical protein V4539_24580 [Bacteroidota bacterium]